MIPSFPDAFVLKLLRQELSLINAFRRLVEKVQTRTEQQLRETRGIHLEPIKSNPPYHSIRLDKGPRAKVLIDGDRMVFLDLDQDHEKFYGK
ncbi:MAG: hypothetical protein QOK37_4651 [Thermoanaerobaculia bacterium]|nr:hypothetical protein [Thermoanaerobaculia bacterium]